MNHCYKVIWNASSATPMAVPESAKGAGAGVAVQTPAWIERGTKVVGHFFIKPLVAALICMGFMFASHAAPLTSGLTAPAPSQLPTGAQVSVGNASVSQSGAVMTITQSSDKAALNWQTFHIGSQATVQFEQPSAQSVTLNRVLDQNPSQIFGQLKANGTVFLQNPHGVYFSPSASVDVGSFVATTHQLSDADVLAGNHQFSRAQAIGHILNEGQLTARLGGYIALLAPEVRNLGVVVAKGGTIALAAGETYRLQFEANDRLTQVLVSPATVAAYVENRNAVIAPGGLVILSAQAANAIQGGVVNNAGSIQANALVNDGGVVRLVASHSLSHTGSITADAAPVGVGQGGRIDIIANLDNPESRLEVNGDLSAKGGAAGGHGGQIETSGSHVRIGDDTRVATNAPQGTGGTWLIDPTDFTVGTGAGSDMSGTTLGTNLNSGSVTIMSSSGGSGTSGDIHINDAVSWTAANKLTLSAANNIHINNAIHVPTGGSVALVYGTSVGTGDYNFGSFSANKTQFAGSINFAGTGAGLFTTQWGANAVDSYTVITNPSTYVLSTNPTGSILSSSGKYALGQNYNFERSFTASPITGSFTGKFEGLGHTVGNLTGTGAIGLFNNSSGLIRDVGVNMSTNSAISGTGGLVNTNSGVIKNSFANASIYTVFNSGGAALYGTFGGLIGTNSGLVTNSFSTGTVSGTSFIGGLIGSNGSANSASPSNILNSFSIVTVTGTGSYVGGLIGQNATTGTGASSTVTNSFATGDVWTTGANAGGGLIGYNFASAASSTVAVTDSYATGNLTGPLTNGGSNYYFGGLIGSNTVSGVGANASVTGSHATGNVTVGSSWVGGLIGFNQVNGSNGVANVSNSYATGTVWNNPSSLSKGTGGLLGLNRSAAAGSSSTVTNSHATGAVSAGQSWTGGLIGYNYANASGVNQTISNSYATGAVIGTVNVGGLVGLNQASNSGSTSIEKSYATGSVSGTQGSVGGLVGTNTVDTATSASSNIANSYASGYVSNTSSNYAGGLIGNNATATSSNSAYISNSYATGQVSSGGDSVGGLVGFNLGNGDSRIVQSYATGSVTSTSALGNNVGGLVGSNSGGATNSNVSISQSYATGAVSAAKTVGGLVGNVSAGSGSANIDQSYATSNVQQTAASGVAGGLVGQVALPGTGGFVQISNSFAYGSVTGTSISYLGGLVGKFEAAAKGGIQNSYAVGSVNGSSNMGGLLGSLTTGSTLQNNYWNSSNNAGLHTVNGSVAGKTAATAGIASLSTTQMQTLANFSGWDTNTVWQSLSYFNNQLPFLRQNNTLATITLVSGSSVYGDTPVLSYAITNSFGSAITSPTATGTPVWELFSNGVSVGIQSISSTTNAGAYSLTYNSGIALGNYTIMSGAASNWTVSKAPLGLSVTGTYSGTTSITPTSTTVTGLKNGETMVPTAVTLSDANVATANKYITAITANTGNANGNNYSVSSAFNATPNTTSTNTATLTPIALSVSAVASLTGNTYNGSAYTGTYTSSAMVPADAALISVSGVATGTDAGTYTSNMAVSLSGSAQTNYSNPVITNANLVISPKTITITNTALTADYDGVTSYAALAGLTNHSNTALVGTDAMGGVTQTANKTGVAQAGSFSVTPSAASVTSGNPSNYQFSYVAANHTVNRLAITVANASVNDKVYDGSTTASVGSGQVQGVLAMDVSNISLTPAGSFISANAGSNIAVNVSYGLSGSAAGNYVVTQPTGLTANITPKNISITGQTGASKVYDATTAASMTGGSLSGVVGADDVGLTQGGTFASANVGTGIAITPNNVLTGSQAANYQLTQPTGLRGDITPAILTVEGLSASSKVYDGTTAATLTGVAVARPLGGGQVNFNGTPTGFFADKNVGTNKYIGVTGFTLSGADAGNYMVTGLHGVYGDITKANLSVTGLVANNKVYDGTTAATFTGGTFTGLLGSDVVTASTGLFNNKNAGTAKSVTAVLGGADAGNYAATGLTGHTADVTPLGLTVAGQLAANKVYDANTSAVLSSGSLQGVLAGDTVTLNQSGHFADKNAGLNKAVVASNSLAGADAGNYSVNQPSGVTANISRATLSLSGLTAVDKDYNANTDAVVTGVPIAAALGSDNVSFNGSAAGQFSGKNVGVGKTVLLTGLSLDTANGDGANYVMPSDIGMTASIAQRDLTISGTTVTTKVYDATTTASVSGGSLVGVQGADVLTLSQSGNFADKNVGAGKSVTITDSITGAAKDNYRLVQPTDVTGTITPASLAVSGLWADDKTYDGTTAVHLSGNATAMPLPGDQLTVSGVPTGAFASPHAGTAVPVVIANLSLSGTDAANYTLANITGVTANIDPATLSATVNPFTKVYDGNTQATPTLVLAGWVGRDSHLAVQALATLNSKHVLDANQLTVDSVTLADGSHGELASNYQLAPGQTGVASVTPATLTAAVSAPNKVYDGQTTATPTLAITAGLVGLEQLSVTGTASFNSKDVATAHVVTVDAVSLSDGANGGMASNYHLAAGQTTAAMITPAALTATVNAPNKVYDGNTTATPTLAITAGLVGLEQLSVTGTASFNSKDVATAHVVTVDAVSLSDGANGGMASNYSLAAGQTTAAQITPAMLTVTDVAASSAVSGQFKPGTAVLLGVLGADQVSAAVSVDQPLYTSPGFLSVGSYKQAVLALAGAQASNYAVTPFTTSALNYTVTAIPVQAVTSVSAGSFVAAAMNSLPARNAAPINSQVNLVSMPLAATQAATSASSSVTQATGVGPGELTHAEVPTAQAFDQPMPLARSADAGSTGAGAVKIALHAIAIKEPALVSGFTAQDMDFAPLDMNSDVTQGTVNAQMPSQAQTSQAWVATEDTTLEDQVYAVVREVLQSPTTYQVLTGASSVVFLVKTLAPSLLSGFQWPGNLPGHAPVRVPVPSGPVSAGRTAVRWLGRV